MSEASIDILLCEKKYDEAISTSRDIMPNLASLIQHAKSSLNHAEKYVDTLFIQKYIRVMLLCNWESPSSLRECWNKFTKGNFIWNNIQLVISDPDYFVVINSTTYPLTDNQKKRTIIFRMEPYMEKNHLNQWGEWALPDPTKFFRVCSHTNDYNNNAWELSKTYTQLSTEKIIKDQSLSNILTTVMSNKYHDAGQIKRVDFVKFLEKKGLPIHVYGDNKWNYANYRGQLPLHAKDQGLFPYKYNFNCENNNIKNYYTEKLFDGILAESLTFYSGCYNAKEFIDERAFVYLELSNFERDYAIIEKAIKEDWHTQRLPYILAAKKKVLDYLQVMPRIERIVSKTEDTAYTVNSNEAENTVISF